MEKYEELKMSVVVFLREDIITASGAPDDWNEELETPEADD